MEIRTAVDNHPTLTNRALIGNAAYWRGRAIDPACVQQCLMA